MESLQLLCVLPMFAPPVLAAMIRAAFTGRKEGSRAGRLDAIGSSCLKHIGAAARPAIEAALADDAWLQSCDDSEWTRKELQALLQ